MNVVIFEVVNSAGISIRDTVTLTVQVVPRIGEKVYFFDYNTRVKDVRHEYTMEDFINPPMDDNAIKSTVVTLEAY